MADFERMYKKMINASEDALEALEAGDIERAKSILIAAEQECEDIYIDTCD